MGLRHGRDETGLRDAVLRTPRGAVVVWEAPRGDANFSRRLARMGWRQTVLVTDFLIRGFDFRNAPFGDIGSAHSRGQGVTVRASYFAKVTGAHGLRRIAGFVGCIEEGEQNHKPGSLRTGPKAMMGIRPLLISACVKPKGKPGKASNCSLDR